MEPSSTTKITSRTRNGKALKEAEISFLQCAILVFGKDAAPPFHFHFINQERKDSLALDISLILMIMEAAKLFNFDSSTPRDNGGDDVNGSTEKHNRNPCISKDPCTVDSGRYLDHHRSTARYSKCSTNHNFSLKPVRSGT